MEQVREATAHDVDRLIELTAAFHGATDGQRGAAAAHGTDPGGHAPSATEAAVAPYLSGPDRTALVGTLDDWVAGAALCRVVGADGDRRGVLDVCFVEPGAREVGLGQLLLEHSLDWFRARHCAGVDGTALPGDRAAKQFYESAGFKARLLVMHLPLD